MQRVGGRDGRANSLGTEQEQAIKILLRGKTRGYKANPERDAPTCRLVLFDGFPLNNSDADCCNISGGLQSKCEGFMSEAERKVLSVIDALVLKAEITQSLEEGLDEGEVEEQQTVEEDAHLPVRDRGGKQAGTCNDCGLRYAPTFNIWQGLDSAWGSSVLRKEYQKEEEANKPESQAKLRGAVLSSAYFLSKKERMVLLSLVKVKESYAIDAIYIH